MEWRPYRNRIQVNAIHMEQCIVVVNQHVWDMSVYVILWGLGIPPPPPTQPVIIPGNGATCFELFHTVCILSQWFLNLLSNQASRHAGLTTYSG